MSITWVRWVDRFAGVPLCFLFTLFRRLANLVAPPKADGPIIRRLLFLKPAEQGATVLAVPAFDEAIRRLGPENVFVCVFTRNREILDILGIIRPENILTIRDNSLLLFLYDVLRMLWAARRFSIDTVVDFESFARFTALLTFLTGAHYRAGWHRFASEGMYRGDLFTHRFQYNPYLSTAQSYLSLTEAVWMDPAAVPMAKAPAPVIAPDYQPSAYHPSPEEVTRVRALLEAGGIAGDGARPRLVLNPKFLDELPVRQWSGANFAGVARQFLDAFPEGSVVVVGLPIEMAAAEAFCAELGGKRVLNLAGKINLRELVTLLGMCDALLSSDSGPAHFAALTDIRVYVMFGPETPVLFAPLTPRTRVFHFGLACSPCFNASNYRLSICRDNQCMKVITPDSVFEAIRRDFA
jgi:ADP-heptose:LPS heptosyltransferase